VVLVVSVFTILIYMSVLPKLTQDKTPNETPSFILEITHLKVNPDGSFTINVTNNAPIPESGFTPPSQRWHNGEIIVYDRNNEVIFTIGEGSKTLPPSSQQTKTMTIYMQRMTPEGIKRTVPLEIGMSVVLLGVTETGQEIYSNKAVYNG